VGARAACTPWHEHSYRAAITRGHTTARDHRLAASDSMALGLSSAGSRRASWHAHTLRFGTHFAPFPHHTSCHWALQQHCILSSLPPQLLSPVSCHLQPGLLLCLLLMAKPLCTPNACSPVVLVDLWAVSPALATELGAPCCRCCGVLTPLQTFWTLLPGPAFSAGGPHERGAAPTHRASEPFLFMRRDMPVLGAARKHERLATARAATPPLKAAAHALRQLFCPPYRRLCYRKDGPLGYPHTRRPHTFCRQPFSSLRRRTIF